MKVVVRMFGALADAAGADQTTLDLDPGSRAADVLRAVIAEHPQAERLGPQLRIAVNLEMVSREAPLSDGDEVALLPPLAGGEVRILTGLREAGASDEEVLGAVASPQAGGTVLFRGTVRDHAPGWGEVTRLEYSAYGEMAERALAEIAAEAASRWPLCGVAILHSTGDLRVGDPTVVIACSAPHRAEAFEACRWAIDEVKERVPIWKRESGPGGTRWVGAEEHSHNP